jgi:signal peptidase II
MTRILVTTAAVFAIDQISKWLVVWRLGLIDRGVIEVWPPVLTLRMAWNRGVNFGLFAQDNDIMRWGLIAAALAISGGVLFWIARTPQRPPAQIAAGLLVGGALGNVLDRVIYGAVADFLNMSCCGIENPYAFNVADVAIFLGAVGLVLFAAEGGTGGKASSGARRKTP